MEDNNQNKNETQNKETQETDFDINKIIENEDFQNYLQSFSDKRVSEAIKTNEKKWKQKLDEEKKKAEMSQEEILQQKEKELLDREMRLEKIQYFKEKEYDLDLLDFVFGEDMEQIMERSDLLVTVINKVVEKQVKARLKNGYVPPREDGKNKSSESIGMKLAKQVAESNQSMQESQNQYFK